MLFRSIRMPNHAAGAVRQGTRVVCLSIVPQFGEDCKWENSKSLTWSSVWRAFEKTEGKPVAARPKDLGDIRGISYIYGIFYRFGLIEVPEQVRVKMAE